MRVVGIGAGVGLGVVAAVLAAAAPAAAQVMRPPRVAGASHATSSNWAGYAATGSVYRSVSASWDQPAVTCLPGETSYASFWAGLDGFTSRTVEQVGTDSDCRDGVPTYSAWYEAYPKTAAAVPLTVAAGDPVTVSVASIPARQRRNQGRFSLSITVGGQPRFSAEARVPQAALSSAEVITEAPSANHGPFGTLGLADFGGVTFTGATVDGAPLADASPQQITMEQGGVVKAAPLPLSGGTFTVTWEHS